MKISLLDGISILFLHIGRFEKVKKIFADLKPFRYQTAPPCFLKCLELSLAFRKATKTALKFIQICYGFYSLQNFLKIYKK